MKTCTTERRIARADAPDPLAVVVETMDEITCEMSCETICDPEAPGGGGAPRSLFGARPDRHGFDLSLRAIDAHPVDELTGFRAPDDWWCAGVATGAWASTYDESASRPVMTDLHRRRVRLVYAVDRSGASMSIYREAGADPIIERHHDPAVERAGALDDTLRRVLDLPTAPAGSTLEYFATRWVDAIFTGVANGSLVRPTWRKIAALHEVHAHACTSSDPQLRRWAVSHIVRAGEILAQARPWSVIRELAIEQCEQLEHSEQLEQREAPAAPTALPLVSADAADGSDTRTGLGVAMSGGGGLSADVLRWMDDGIFSRSVMGRYPPLEVLMLDLHDLLPASVYGSLVDTIGAWGLLDA